MIASVQVANIGARRALGVLRSAPRPGSIPGLLHADVGLAAELSGSLRPSPDFGRVGVVMLWDDDASLDAYLAHHPLAEKLASGWRVRLAPLRAHGSWPGLPTDIPSGRAADHDGPAVVLTLGRLRVRRVVPFSKASAKAEARVIEAPGLIWATGLARPPFLATCSLWQDTRALSTYAYGTADPAHPDAIASDRERPFHKQSAFVRFAPSDSRGGLEGKNPLPETWMA